MDRVEGPEVRQEVASFSETRLRSSAMLGRREERYIGKEMPVHSNAIGKAILANLPRAVTLRILKEQGLPRITRRTITSRTGLLNQLDLYHAQGYACSMEEQHEGIHGLAVHLTDSNGTVRAAIGLTPTVEQARSELKDLHLSALRRAAQSISKRARFQQ